MDLHIQTGERRESKWVRGIQIGQEKVEKGKGYWKQTYRYW